MRPGCGSPSVSRRNWSVARVSSTSSNRWGPEGAFPTPSPPKGATARNRPPRGGLPDTSASGRGALFPGALALLGPLERDVLCVGHRVDPARDGRRMPMGAVDRPGGESRGRDASLDLLDLQCDAAARTL